MKIVLWILALLSGTAGLLLNIYRWGGDLSRMPLEVGNQITFVLCIGFVAVIEAIEKSKRYNEGD